mmetsp:Transcript_46840/g.100173  ORF Transcript_46840/g.100173 Transcript_46840/m.100173 type:complete len:524 (+) Transcript_46840:104-1675(+)
MPLVVCLVLLDAGPHEQDEGGGIHVATAAGLYAEMERQLQDPSSRLRRKSALGALVAHGAFLRFLGHERVSIGETSVGPQEDDEVQDVNEVPVISQATCAGGSPAEDDVGVAIATATAATREPPRAPGGNGGGFAAVPPIAHFPTPARLACLQALEMVGLPDFLGLFDWMPVCARQETCSGVDSCTILALNPEAPGNCAHLHGEAPCREPTASNTHEAGLGGWPLCVPHAYVAYSQPLQPLGREAEHIINSVDAAPVRVPPEMSRDSAIPTASFRRAAVEVDDQEVAIIIRPQRGQTYAGVGSKEATPSTVASTAEASASSVSSSLPSAALPASGRCVVPLGEISGVKLRPQSNRTPCWPPTAAKEGFGPPWPHIVEFTGAPRGGPRVLTVLLALPSGELAARFFDALNRAHLQPRSLAQRKGDSRGGVKCELHIAVDIDFEVEGNAINCAAVVRRGISEACHVTGSRLRICSIRGDPASAAEVTFASPFGLQMGGVPEATTLAMPVALARAAPLWPPELGPD